MFFYLTCTEYILKLHSRMLSISIPFSQTAVELTTTMQGFHAWKKSKGFYLALNCHFKESTHIFQNILLWVKDYLQLQFNILIFIKSLQKQYHTYFYKSFLFCSSPRARFPWRALLLFLCNWHVIGVSASVELAPIKF